MFNCKESFSRLLEGDLKAIDAFTALPADGERRKYSLYFHLQALRDKLPPKIAPQMDRGTSLPSHCQNSGICGQFPNFTSENVMPSRCPIAVFIWGAFHFMTVSACIRGCPSCKSLYSD